MVRRRAALSILLSVSTRVGETNPSGESVSIEWNEEGELKRDEQGSCVSCSSSFFSIVSIGRGETECAGSCHSGKEGEGEARGIGS